MREVCVIWILCGSLCKVCKRCVSVLGRGVRWFRVWGSGFELGGIVFDGFVVDGFD